MDLKNLQNRARRNITRDANESILKRNRKRLSPLRISIWLAEALVLLIVIEYLFFRPQPDQTLPEHRGVDKSSWEQAQILGEDALQLAGLREAENIYLPPTGNLAAGGVSAREAQRVVSSDLGLPLEVVNSAGIHFRLIPNGSFIMGSPSTERGHWEGEKQHLVQIKTPFYISKTEITQAQWKAVMGESSNPAGFKGAERPVEEVSWYDCQNFLVALAEQEGVPKWTYRLPTEEQWEYAARAGTETAYYFGDNPARLEYYEWYDANSFGSTHSAGRLYPNAYGLYDMLGNVWEWCWSTYKPYPGSPEKLSEKHDWKRIRVIRGGNWMVNAELCRVANRARLGPTSKGNTLGFRVVRFLHELEPQSETE